MTNDIIMKSVFIVYNQAFTERVEYMLDRLQIMGFTQWSDIYGRGSVTGKPHMGTHTWPEINNATMAIIEDEKVDVLLEKVSKLNQVNEEIGVRAFVWNIEKMV
jgi:nitrogen regulatory protein PII